MSNPLKKRRGFAVMIETNPELQKKIAGMGGVAAHAIGRAHKWTSEEASAAAAIAHRNGTCHEYTPEEAKEAGRKGGMAKAARRRQREQQIALQQQNAISATENATVPA